MSLLKVYHLLNNYQPVCSDYTEDAAEEGPGPGRLPLRAVADANNVYN